MSVMLSSSVLLSRLFVSVLIHAAALSFFTTSQAAEAAGSTQLSSHDAVERSVAWRFNTPNGHHRFLSNGLMSPKNGIQARSRSETGAKGTYADKLSTFKHQPPLVQYAQSSSYGPYSKNVRDEGQQPVGMTQTRTSGMMPVSSIFTSHSLLGGQSFERPKEEDQTLPPAKTHTRNPHSSYYVVKRVSLLNKTLSFPQTGKYKPSKTGDPSNVNEGPSFHPLLFSPPTNEARRAPPLPTRVHYKSFKDTNELPTGKAPGYLNPSAPFPRNPPEVRRNPSREKTSSTPSFSKTLDPVSSRRMQGHKKIILYPSKDSRLKDGERGWINAPKQSPFGTPWYGRFNPNLEHPNRMDHSNRQSSTEHDTNFYAPKQSPSQASLVQNVVPLHHPSTQTNYASSNKRTSLLVNSTVSTQDYKPGPKRLQRIRGFASSLRQPVKEPSSPTRTTSPIFSLPGIKTRPFLLQKYSFGQGGKSPTMPLKPEQVDGSSLSPDELNITNLPTDPTFRSIATESKNSSSKSDASLDRNPNQARLSLYKGKFGLEGFATPPLEGDKVLLKSPEMIAPHGSGLEGLKLKSLNFWQPNVIKIIGRYNQTGTSRESQKMRGDYFKSHPEIEVSNGSLVSTNDGKDSRPAKIFSRAHRKLEIPFFQIASSAHLRMEEHPQAADTFPSLADGGTKPVEKLQRTFTSSTVRGRPVRLRNNKKVNGSVFRNMTRILAPIYRLPKSPGKIKAVTYNDIPGSASFSSIRATGVTVPSPVNTRINNATEQEVQTDKSRDGRLEAKSENKTEASQVVKEAKFNEDVDDIKMPELFLRSNGSKGFNVSEVLSVMERHQNVRENLLELDYLQTSTGNIFFKSLKQSSPGKQ